MQFREFNLRIIIINCLKFNIVNVKGTFINVVANSVFDFYVSARENFQGSTLVYYVFCINFISLLLCVIEPKIFTGRGPELNDYQATNCHNNILSTDVLVVKASKYFT